MGKEIISDRQGIAIIALFMLGSTSIFVPGIEAKKDIWLASLLGLLMVLPIVFICTRFQKKLPNNNFFDILEICFGKYIGKILIFINICYLIFFTSEIFVNYGQFVTTVNLPQTPRIVLIALIGILTIWVSKEGIEVLGRWSEFFILLPIVFIIIFPLLLIPKMDINNLRPVLEEGVRPILKGAFSVFNFPLAQIVIFSMTFANFKNEKSSFKVYITSILISFIYLFILSITNILTLGADTMISTYYPAYISARRINLGQMFQRIEVTVALVFVLCSFVKMSVLLLTTTKGISKLFNFKDYRFLVTPVALLIINLSYFQYDSVMQFYEFSRQIWIYFFLPFLLFIPVITFVVFQFKIRCKKIN